MKAIRLLETGNLQLCEVPMPEIGEEELLIKVGAASICGTDVRMWKNGAKVYPLTLGHEFAGEITEVGPKVKGYAAGERVAVAPNIGCGHCAACFSGNTHLCPEMQAFGVTMDGGFAEYVRVPVNALLQGNLMKLGENTTYEQGALLEPLSCVWNGQTLLGIRPGDDVLVIGLGPIGIMHIEMAKLLGAGRVFVTDLVFDRIDQAVRMFPDVLPIAGDVLTGLAQFGLGGVDICIIAAPSPQAQADSLSYMNRNGRILYFGGLPDAKKIVPIDTNLLHYKQLRIQGCTRQSISAYRSCAKLVEDRRILLKGIVSHTYALEEFETAFERAAAAEGLKHAFRISEV